MSLEKVAKHLASKGRGEDTLLVHMTPGEVQGLHALAKAHGGSLTVNPDTGLPEAGFLKSILPTLVGLGLTATGVGAPFAAAAGAATGALLNQQDPLMGAVTGGLGAYGGASLGAGINQGLSGAAAAEAANAAAGATPMATTGLETVSPEIWPGQVVPQTVAPVAIPQPVAPTITEAAPTMPTDTEYWPAGAHTPPVKPTFGESVEAAFKNPKTFVEKAGGLPGLMKYGLMAASPLLMYQDSLNVRRPRYSGDGAEYEYIPGYTGGEPSSSSYTGERRYFAPTYRKLAEGGEVTPAPQQMGYNPVIPQQSGIAGLSQAPQAPAFVANPGGVAPVSDQEIKQYVQNTLATPGMTDTQRAAQINAAAYQYDVPRARLAAAAGYDLPTANAYLSGIPNLPTSYGSTLPDTRGYGQMTGASADAMRYLYGMPGATTAERVTQPITTASTSDIGAKAGAPPTQGGSYTDPNTGKTWTQDELAAGGYYEKYTEGGGESGGSEYMRWVPAPKAPAAPAPAPQSEITDAAIKNYISGILTDPSMSDAQRAAAINKAASENKVDRQRIAAATGYDIGTVNKYLDYVAPPVPWTGAPKPAPAAAPAPTPTPTPPPTAPTPAPKPAPAPAPSASGSWTPEEIAAGGKRVDVPWGDGGTMSRWVPYPGASAPQPAPQPAPAPQQQYSTAEIKSYVDNILNDPSMTAAQRAAAINKAASQYGVSRARLAEATGYSPQQVEEYLGKAYAAGGGLRSGGFVVPADVVSALGNGSTDAGLEVLMKKFNAKPIDGPGDGMSDSIPTTIEGKQKARVARGEAYIAPEDVQKFGGSKKFYAMLDRIRHNAHGKKTQQRQVNPNKLV